MEWLKKNWGKVVLGLLLIASVWYTGYVTDYKFTKQTI